MASRRPSLVAVDNDEYSARYVGRTADGHQFFLTNPFVPAIGDSAGCEFVALYLFGRDGLLIEARIEDLGPRSQLDRKRAQTCHDKLLESLGDVNIGRINVQPFRVERNGVEFGFIVHPPEEPGDEWQITVEPGNYMSFFPPWTSGEYDT